MTDGPMSKEAAMVEQIARAMYDAWPHKVFSEQLATLTGKARGAKLTYDDVLRVGGDHNGLLRLADAAAEVIRTAVNASLAERDAEIARLRKLVSPAWFYLAGDMSSDRCRFSPSEVIDEDWLWDNRAEGSAVVQIETATPCPDIWCAVRFFTNEEKDARQSDDDYELTEHATEEAARAALEPKQ